jgi:hypothetical protein
MSINKTSTYVFTCNIRLRLHCFRCSPSQLTSHEPDQIVLRLVANMLFGSIILLKNVIYVLLFLTSDLCGRSIGQSHAEEVNTQKRSKIWQ